MAEPIVVDGMARKITITIPSTFSTKVSEDGKRVILTVEPAGDEKSFHSIAVTQEEEGSHRQKFSHTGLDKAWRITVGRE